MAVTTVQAYCAKLNQQYISEHHELVRLLKRGEGIHDLLHWSPDALLIRWLNHHLARGGHQERVESFEDDFSDCNVLAKVMKQISPKQTDGIDSVTQVSDKFERAAALLKHASALGCSQFATATDIGGNKSENVKGLVAELFVNHTAIRMPTEAEINELFKDVDSLRYELKECKNCNERYLARIEILKADMAEIEAYKNKLNSQLNARRSDLKERSAELAATVEAKDKEIAALHAEIASIEHDCDEARAALSDVKAGKKSAGDELSKALAAERQRVSELEGRIDDRKNGNKQMQDMLDGKGANMEEIESKLKGWMAQNEDKAAQIIDYCAASEEIFREAAEKAGAPGLVKTLPDSADEKQRLQAMLETQEAVLEKYSGILEEKRAAHAKTKLNEKRRLEDLQRSVADFLGEGQTDAGDAIGNMKRLLQLLADKSKQQSRQIQSLEIEKEKLDHLNTIMAEKVKVIAEERVSKSRRGWGGQ